MKTKSLLTFGLVAFIILNACKPEYAQPGSEQKQYRSVVVEQLLPTTLPIPIEVSGVISSKIEARLSFKLPGIVQRILVEEGQKVNQGQLLAHLDLAEINAMVLQAQNAVDKSKRDLSRVQNLYRDSVATLEQLQDHETLLEVNQAELRIAKFNQKYSQIIAPTAGKIHRRFIEQGELISAGTPAFTFGSEGQGSYIMRVALADVDIVKLAPGDSASIWFDAYPGQSFTAWVTEIAEAADPLTGTFETELTLDPGVLPIKSGFIGKASIYPSNQPPYVRISINALVEGYQQKANVFFFDEQTGKALMSELQPLHIDNSFFTVAAEAIEPYRKVIIDGSAYIHHGEIVSPVNPTP